MATPGNLINWCYFFRTHIASSLICTSSAHHGGFHGAAPPVAPGAGIVVHYRKVGLFELSRQAPTGWVKMKRNKALSFGPNSSNVISWSVPNITNKQINKMNKWTHWKCVPIQWCSRSCCGAESGQREAEGQAGRKRSGWPQRTVSAEQCHSCNEEAKVILERYSKITFQNKHLRFRVNDVHKKETSPIGHSVRVPLGVDVNLGDTNDLLSATVDVEVMFTENHTECPGAATIYKRTKNKK